MHPYVSLENWGNSKHKVWGPHSGVTEDSVFWDVTMWLGEYFLTFWGIIMFLVKQSKNTDFLDCLTMKIKALQILEMW